MRIEARNITSQWVYIVLILTVIASGCNSTAGETVMPTRQPEAGNSTGSPEPTAIPSTPTHEVTPTDTPTATVQALSGTSTTLAPQATFTPITPIATFSTEQRNKFIVDLLLHNGNCQYPCFWGVIPGETSWDEARQKIQLSYSEHNWNFGYKQYAVEAQNWEDRLILTASFFVKDGIVVWIEGINYIEENSWLESEYAEWVSLKADLLRNGIPDRIMLNVSLADTPNQQSGVFWVFVYYDQRGVLIYQSGDIYQVNGQFNYCPNQALLVHDEIRDVFHSHVVIKSEFEERTLDALAMDAGGVAYWKSYSEGNKPIEEILGISVKEFYEITVKDGFDACFPVAPDAIQLYIDGRAGR